MYSLLAFGFPSGFEWLVVLLVALLIFGSRLPRIMRGLGSSVREFRDGMETKDQNGQASTQPEAPASDDRQRSDQ